MGVLKSIAKAIIPASVRANIREAQKRRRHANGKFECNFCGSRVAEWDPRGIKSEVIERLDIVPTGYRFVTCPFCQSYDRDRLLYFFLIRHTKLFQEPTKLLHIAPETTIELKVRDCKTIDYLSGDLDGRLAMEAMDCTTLRFAENSFDALICNHVLEHIPEDAKAMAELLRVVKPGGWAVLQVPIGVKLEKTIEDFTLKTDQDRLEKFGQIDHVRVYSLHDYLVRLDNAGWEVTVIDFPKELGPEVVEKFGLHPREKIVFCRKTAVSA